MERSFGGWNVVKCSEILGNRVSNIIRGYIYIDHMTFAAFMAFLFIVFLHVFFWVRFYDCVYGWIFCVLLFNSASHVLLLLRLCIHRANRHSPATLTEVFPCLFLSCKTNATLQLAKTGHGQHYSKLGY